MDEDSDGSIKRCDSNESQESLDDQIANIHPQLKANISVGKINKSHVANVGDIVTIGKLTVVVKDKAHEWIKSAFDDDYNLFEDAQKHLIHRYLTVLCKSTPIPWCPNFKRSLKDHYINLQLVTRDKKYGLSNNVQMELEDIFKSYNSCSPSDDNIRVCIEGDTGYGKTTLMSKIAFDWATMFQSDAGSCHEYMRRFTMVIVIALRKLQALDIEDYLFQEVFPKKFKSKRKSLVKCLEKEQNKVLFILDGYDEVKSETFRSVIEQLLDGKVFPRSSVILTSCPIATGGVLQYFDSRLKISGFSDKNMKQFINCYFDESEKSNHRIKLFDVINSSKSSIYKTLSACPLFLLLLCVMIEEKGDELLPTRKTDILHELVRCSIKRTLMKSKQDVGNVFEEYKDTVSHLGLLCLKALIVGQGYLTKYELSKQIQFENDGSYIGLFTRTSNASITDDNDIFEPIHRVFMEFLAAFHLHLLFEDAHLVSTELNFIYHSNYKLREVLLLLAGLLGQNAYKLFNILLNSVFKNEEKFVFALLHESGASKNNVIAIQNLLNVEFVTVQIKQINLESIMHILRHPKCQVKNVVIKWNQHGSSPETRKQFFEVLAVNRSVRKLTLRTLLHPSSRLEDSDIKELSSLIPILASSKKIETFVIQMRECDQEKAIKYQSVIEAICIYIHASCFVKKLTIHLYTNSTQIISICDAIKVSDSIEYVDFPFLSCSKPGFIALSNLISGKPKLKCLSLIRCHEILCESISVPSLNMCSLQDECIDDKKRVSVDSAPYCHSLNTSIRDVNVMLNSSFYVEIEPEDDADDCMKGFHHVMKALEDPNCFLESVVCSFWNTGSVDVLCAALSANVMLRVLMMKDLKCFDQIRSIFVALKSNSNLQHLDLSSQGIIITDKEIKSLLSLHLSNSGLKHLEMKKWRFAIDEIKSVEILFNTLKSFKKLSELTLDLSKILISFRTDNLFDSLRNNKWVFKYLEMISMNGVQVDDGKEKKTKVIERFAIATQFSPRILDLSASLMKNYPIYDKELMQVFKLVSKLKRLNELRICDWKIILHNPESTFQYIQSRLSSHNLMIIDLAGIEVTDKNGSSLIHRFVCCLLNALKHLDSITFNVNEMPKNVIREIAQTAKKAFAGLKRELKFFLPERNYKHFSNLEAVNSHSDESKSTGNDVIDKYRFFTSGEASFMVDELKKQDFDVDVDSVGYGWIQISRKNNNATNTTLARPGLRMRYNILRNKY
ncbi:Uncharacterised protein g9473 [Pycnogonum litorale]